MGGSAYDFLTKSNSSGDVGTRKGYGALGLRYIICTGGTYPSSSSGGTTGAYMGEIRLVAFFGGAVFPPNGWSECNGQLLNINQNMALFSLLGITYGGNGQSTFGLPDLRGAVLVGAGTAPAPAGYAWDTGEKVQ